MFSIIVSPPLGASKPRGFTFSFFNPPEKNFPKDIVIRLEKNFSEKYYFQCVCDFFFTFSTIRSIKYCIGPKNRPRDFDGSPRFEGHWVQKSNFWHVVCVCVCVSVCGHYNSKNNWASSTTFGMWSYMIKISAGIVYEQNPPHGCGLYPDSTIRIFFFLAKSALKMHCTKKNFRQKLL